MNKARGQGYGAAAAVNPNAGPVVHIAAEMNRNLEEVRRKNLLGKREIYNKPPTAYRKPVVAKVSLIRSNILYLFIVFSQQILIKLMNNIVLLMIKKLYLPKKKKK